jgi:hypothetical protein
MEHCVRAPGAGTCDPMSTASAFEAASPRTGTVVSSSRKPNATAVAASAPSRSGSSRRLVTWAWMDGVRRTRIFAIEDSTSKGRRRETTRASLAGVIPATRRVTSLLGKKGSTIIRAISRSVAAIASGAAVASIPCRAMYSSMRSNAADCTPSSSTTFPSASSASDGSLSCGPRQATRPISGSSAARPSRLTGLLSNTSKRPVRRCFTSSRRSPSPSCRNDSTCRLSGRRS